MYAPERSLPAHPQTSCFSADQEKCDKEWDVVMPWPRVGNLGNCDATLHIFHGLLAMQDCSRYGADESLYEARPLTVHYREQSLHTVNSSLHFGCNCQ